jgi:quercetin dioxygenase-like cupin family protein
MEITRTRPGTMKVDAEPVTGDVVRFEPGEEHWHGAAATWFMTHLAFREADDEGRDAEWQEHVTDEDYGSGPAVA